MARLMAMPIEMFIIMQQYSFWSNVHSNIHNNVRLQCLFKYLRSNNAHGSQQ